MASLLPCSACGRHLRASTATCPFCAAVQPASDAITSRAPAARARRAVAVAAASLSVAACTPTTPAPSPEPAATAKPPSTTTATTTATATATTTATAIGSVTPTASSPPGAGTMFNPPSVGRPAITNTGTRYGLPPFLDEDELV